MYMNIIPMQGRIVVKEVKPIAEAKGGLLVPDSAKEKALIRGIVVARGNETPDYDCSPIERDKEVLFIKYSAQDVEDKGEVYMILRYEDVLATINN